MPTAEEIILEEIIDYNWEQIYPELLKKALKQTSDDDLESWRVYLLREQIEAKMKNKDKVIRKMIKDELGAVEAEKGRREYIANQGGPKYDGKSRQKQVRRMKEHFVGDVFVDFFAWITGHDVFPDGSNPDRWKYRCTRHGEDKNPSGRLYADEGRWHCFGCNNGGDIFKLVMEYNPGMTFGDAVKFLQNWIPEYQQKEDGSWKRINK